MAFPGDVVRRAWIRQGGLCAHCGKGLSWGDRDKTGIGSWHAHHRKPESFIDGNSIANCIILCTDHPNCHLKIGHSGNPDKRAQISDVLLPYLYTGHG